MLTGKKSNMSKLQKFGSRCFAYNTLEKGKLESRCVEGIFIGYDKNSAAYLVYYADTEKVQKHRLVKFTSRTTVEKETQTKGSYTEYHDREVFGSEKDIEKNDNGKTEGAPNENVQSDVSVPEGEQQGTERVTRTNPPRIRRKPGHLQDYETDDTINKIVTSVDHCYRAVCDIPQNYQDAIRSTKS